MIFHIIDLREVDDWLPCVECRCRDANGTYLDLGGSSDALGVSLTGGVDCCQNCTDLTTPTVDYRMRYNVSFSDIEPDEPVTEVLMLTADISPVVDKAIEYDVPYWGDLLDEFVKDDDPFTQRLVREEPFRDMFQMEFFGDDYNGPETVKILRCVGHLHVATIGMWLEDTETGDMLCSGNSTYGTDPDQDKGFLTAVHVDNYVEPKVIPADRVVRLIVEYNATELHTGVMGMEFMFISGERQVTATDAELSVDICMRPTCDTSQLPQLYAEDYQGTATCADTLEENAACKFGGLCDCETLINATESTGCGGVYSSSMGDIEVNSVCAKSCGCQATNCQDALPESPSCTFGGLCDCETFVNSPESTGCGGVYTSEFGSMEVNDMCANYCDACPEKSWEEYFEDAFVEELEASLESRCQYATEECRETLHNAYSCSLEPPGLEELHPVLRQAMVAHGSRLAFKHAELGSSSLHRNSDGSSRGSQLF